MVIWKWTIDPGSLVFSVPTGTKIISAHNQHGQICVWGEVPDPHAALDEVTLEVIGTGHEASSRDRRFIDTVLLGALVFHIYEVTS